MTKRKSVFPIFLMIAMAFVVFAGCSNSPKPITKDGVVLSEVKFSNTEKTDSQNIKYKDLAATFSLENTTNDKLKVEITLSYLADIWGTRVSEKKTFMLEPKEKTNKTITKEKVYSMQREKKVSISSVTKI